MAEVKKKTYRLFKVAKEFNLGMDTIVEFLQKKGFDLDISPNTKLLGEHYDVLLKEFSSDKNLKEKAELIIEQRREEGRTVVGRGKPEETAVPKEEPEAEKAILSADQLRSTIRRRPLKGSPRPENEPVKEPEPPVETPEEKAPEPEKVEAKAEAPVPSPEVEEKAPVEEVIAEKQEEPVVEETEVEQEEDVQEEVAETPGLKVVGKIELEDKPQKRKRRRKKGKPAADEPKPVAEKPAPEVVEAPVEKAPVVESDQDDPETESEEPKTVITAEGNTPNLRGLKVLKKIDLPGAKPPKKDAEKGKGKGKPETAKAAADNKETSSDDDGPKKKRRRRKRKRSKSSEVNQNANNKRNDSGKGGSRKKEKPTQKEVDDSIKSTLSKMRTGPSRERQRLRRAKRDADAARRERQIQEEEASSNILELTEFITANEFANLINVQVNDIITKSFQLGIMVSINQRLDKDLLSLLAEEYGYIPEFIDPTEQDFELVEEEDDPENLVERRPIITVMGHVDHGKTTLLDFLRKTNVTASEAGGITQHIGAYSVGLKSGREVTFLDTPGHEAFTAMRARGAKVTDVVIIVVAADDAVMPQTKEAINHAQAASVPIVFAINKIDKPGADPERIKGQLAEMNILVEDWGGNYQSQEISALKGDGVDELLEKVTLESELLELKANPERKSSGTVIEARLDKGRGNVATILVQNGTLNIGDEMVAGIHYGKVRAMINQNGRRIKIAGPSTPVQILGLNGHPTAGDKFHVFDEDGKAKSIAQKRSELFREQQFRQNRHITLEEITKRPGNYAELNIIIRGDVDGSVEALAGSLLKLSTDEVQVNIIMKMVGAINENDVQLAAASDAIILAFNVRPSSKARILADREGIDIRFYSIIYDAINDVRDALEGLLSPEIKEEIVGTAEVLQVFKVSKVGTVAGCRVESGKIIKNEPARVIRDGVVIYDSKLTSLKRFKDDAKEVVGGQEFGAMVENYNDIKVGDVIESYRKNEIKRTL